MASSPAVLRDGAGQGAGRDRLAAAGHVPVGDVGDRRRQAGEAEPAGAGDGARRHVERRAAGWCSAWRRRGSWTARKVGRRHADGGVASFAATARRGRQVIVSNADYSVFEPNARQSIEEVAVFDDRIVATIYDNVRGTVSVFTDKGEGGWAEAEAAGAGERARSISARPAARRNSLFLTLEGFLTPSTLSLANVGHAEGRSRSGRRRRGSMRRSMSSSSSRRRRADGTKIPYFVVRPKDAPLDGSTPTLMFGYGGFQVSLSAGLQAGAGQAVAGARRRLCCWPTSAAAASSGRRGTRRR